MAGAGRGRPDHHRRRRRTTAGSSSRRRSRPSAAATTTTSSRSQPELRPLGPRLHGRLPRRHHDLERRLQDDRVPQRRALLDRRHGPSTINGEQHQLGDDADRSAEPERERAPLGHDLQLLVRRDRSRRRSSEVDRAVQAGAVPGRPHRHAPGQLRAEPGRAFDNPTLTAPTGPSGDDVSLNVPIGFTFNFYGTNYTTVNICTNGFLQFGGSRHDVHATPASRDHGRRTASSPGYWDDLFAERGPITYQTIGSAPNRRFVASWNNVRHYPARRASFETFKIILDETTNKITTHDHLRRRRRLGRHARHRAPDGQRRRAGLVQPAGLGGRRNVADLHAGARRSCRRPTSRSPEAPARTASSRGRSTATRSTRRSSSSRASIRARPTSDALGVINLGLTPGLYAVIADGAGALAGRESGARHRRVLRRLLDHDSARARRVSRPGSRSTTRAS